MNGLTRMMCMLAVFAGIVMASHSLVAAPLKGDLAIVPGSNIGKTFLGPKGADYLRKLHAETASEAGMSQNRLVWVSGKGTQRHTLFIHTTANGALDVKPVNGVTIDEIRITSPEFRTANGIGCGSTLRQILTAFPKTRYAADSGGIFYDDGIAFEFNGDVGKDSVCIAITVFARNVPRFTSEKQVEELIKDSSRLKN